MLYDERFKTIKGDSFEKARANLQDVIEGNVLLALQLGLEIPHVEGIEIKKLDHAKAKAAQS